MADGTVATQQPTPIEYKLDDGTVVKAASAEEALATLAKMKVDTANALKAEKQAREALQQQVSTFESQRQAEAARQRVDQGAFDKDTYFRILSEDPVAAQNYVDAYRFNTTPDNVVPRFVHMSEQIDKISAEAVAGQFLQQHFEDFPATPENAKMLTERVRGLVENQGFNMSLDTLNYVYGQLVDEGAITPLAAKSAEELQREQQEQQPNPALRGGGASTTLDASEEEKMAKMNDDQLREYMRSKGVRGA